MLYSTKFPPKRTTCLREQPAPPPSTPLAHSHLCTTDRRVQTAFCIPSLFHVNLFYQSKYHLQIIFVSVTMEICSTKGDCATAYIHKLPSPKIHIANSNMLSHYVVGQIWVQHFLLADPSFEVVSVAQSYIHISHAGWEIAAYFPLARFDTGEAFWPH